MIEKIISLFKGIFSHLLRGCSIFSDFARHFAKTLVQILKGGDFHKES